MTIRNQLREALSGLSLDNTPTVERQEKSDFSKKNGAWKTRLIYERLFSQERINQDEYNACERWLVSYILTYDGVGAVQDRASTSEIKHDAISWALTMAQEKDCIPEVKAALGIVAHNLLVMSLYEGLSAASISRALFYKTDRSTEIAVDRMCKSVYHDLYKFYFSNHVDKRSKRGIKNI